MSNHILQQWVVSSDNPPECRNPQTNPSLKTSSQNWSVPVLSWGENKDSQQAGSRLPLVSDSVCGHVSNAEREAEEIEQPKERAETRESRKSQHHRAPHKGSSHHGDNVKMSSIPASPRSSSERTLPQEPFISQVPLRLQIKVSGQRGSLGFSIAGGRGSLPYKDNDEGIFISRVIKGGASEKAGVHVGDRLTEVNGLDMQGATHHQAVSALRNAGSCIKMKVLRERLLPRELYSPDQPPLPPPPSSSPPLDPRDVTGRQLQGRAGGGGKSKQQREESREDSLSRKMETVVCNGNGISDLERDLKRTLSELEAVTTQKRESLQGGKQTMQIPRIILTHPSTSDEDVEFLTQSPGRELPDRRCFDSAFHPP